VARHPRIGAVAMHIALICAQVRSVAADILLIGTDVSPVALQILAILVDVGLVACMSPCSFSPARCSAYSCRRARSSLRAARDQCRREQRCSTPVRHVCETAHDSTPSSRA
jgi:hypothetical protein